MAEMSDMDPYWAYKMTENLISLAPGEVSDSVREQIIIMWNTVGGLDHNESDLQKKGVPRVKITMIRNFLNPTKKGHLDKSANATSTVSTPRQTEKTPLNFDPTSMFSSTYVSGETNTEDENGNGNRAQIPNTVVPESQCVLLEMKKSMEADIYDINNQNHVNERIENLTKNMMKLLEVILDEKNEMKLKMDSMIQEINILKSEKESYASKASKACDFKEIMKQQRFGDMKEQKEFRRMKRDENAGRQLIIFGLPENVTKKADASNIREYTANEKKLAFYEAQKVISEAREKYASRRDSNPADFQDDELVEPPNHELVIDDIEFTSRIRPSNKKRVGMTNDSPTFKRYDEVKKEFVDYDNRRFCKLTATFKAPEWCTYVKECQEYLVLRGNKKYNLSRNSNDLVRRTIQPYLTEKAKENSRLLYKQAKDDEIRRWKAKNSRLADLKEEKLTKEEFDKWLDDDRKDSPSFIEKIMYAKNGWPELKVVKFIEGRSSRYVDPKQFDNELKESS